MKTKTIRNKILTVLAICLCALSAPAQAVVSTNKAINEITNALQKKYSTIKTFEAKFTQEAFSLMLGSSEITKGRVSFKKPSKMRWDYDNGESIISNGPTLWLIQPDLAQVVETKTDGADPNISTDFLSGIGDLSSDFTIRLISNDKKIYRLALVPRRPMGSTKELNLELDRDFTLKKITVIDHFGNETRVSFRDININSKIADSFFIYKKTKGMKIIRP